MPQPPPNWIAPGGNDFSTSGPGIVHNNALYLPGMDYITGNIAVAKTTDLGNDGAQVWTEFLGPAVLPTGQSFWHLQHEAVGIGTKFYFTYQDPITGDQCLVIFDVTTESFGTAITGGPALGMDTTEGSYIKVTHNAATGVWKIVYVAPFVSLNLYARTYNGSWSSAILVDTPSAGGFGLTGDALTDSTGLAHCPYTLGNSPLFTQLWATLTDGGTVTTTTLFSGTFSGDLNVFNYFGIWYDPGTAAFYGGYACRTPANISPTAPQQVNVFVVPQGAPGTWSWIGVGPLATPATDLPLATAVTVSASTLQLVVGSFSISSPSTQGYFQRWQSAFPALASWTGAALYWNWPGSWTPAPPFNNPNFSSLTYINANVIAPGILGLAVGFGFDDSDALWLTGTLPASGTLGLAIDVGFWFPPPLALGIDVAFRFAASLPQPTLACPLVNTGTPGQFLSVQLVPSGGSGSYTQFTLTAGSLPPGMTLNSLTGVISGTPTIFAAGQSYSYSVTVTDSMGQVSDPASCAFAFPLATVPGHTLRWQIAGPERPGRWFQHSYANPVTVHYLVEPSAANPNAQELLLLSAGDGLILESGGNTDLSSPLNSFAIVPVNDGGDERGQKLYPDAMVQADGLGTLNVTPVFDNLVSRAPASVLGMTGQIGQFLVNIASLANLALHRNIGAALCWTGGPSGPRIYAWEPAAWLQPYLSTFLVSQFLNLSYPGWKMSRRFYPALISTAPVTLTIKCQDGRQFQYTIPSTGGQLYMLPMIVDHGLKDLAFAFQLDGHGTPFALFPDEFVIETKGWRDPEFLPLAVWKT